IGHTATSTNLALMTDCGEAKGLLEAGTHEWCKRAQAEESLEGQSRLAVSVDRLAGFRKKTTTRHRTKIPMAQPQESPWCLTAIEKESD
ncbi:MAG TPA: hypothetical protein VKF17_05725, partial [Isosphaeraceae bacterium]|nr:hypothetical protein [Isosphaeraceae bacterium]